jgi:hypothetical protein
VKSLFERTVFKSESGESDYDPQTFTMRFYRPYLETPLGSVILHEIMHWIQSIAYTFGGFISALTHIRDDLSKQILIKYAKSKVDCQNHKVLFSLPEGEAFFNFYFDHEGMERNIQLHQIAWRDARICEYLFCNMSSFYELSASVMASAHEILQPELLIPRTLLRMNNWAIGTLVYRSTEPQGPLEITDFANHPKLINFGRAIYADIELDTIDIIEGMAVAFEMHLFHSNGKKDHAKERLKEIKKIPANAYYVRAIEIFLKIMGFPAQYDKDEEIAETALNIARMAMMFLAIAEMSLNPPLPPFGIINRLELDWNKIYPPRRFIKLCHIAKRVVGERGYILDPNPFTWIFDWIAHVELLYLSQDGVFSYLHKDEDGYLPLEKSVPFLSLIAEENQKMREILQYKGIDSIDMAEKFPGVLQLCTGLELYAMLRHAHILFMNWYDIPRPFLIPFETEFEEGRELYVPPLVIFDDGHASYGWSEDFGQYLIEYNLFHYPLQDIILRQELCLYLTDTPLIDEGRRKRHWDYLRKTFAYIF